MAAFNGNLENGYPHDENVAIQAAKRGHLDIIMWVHAHGCLLTRKPVLRLLVEAILLY